jgi:hypothetical protein
MRTRDVAETTVELLGGLALDDGRRLRWATLRPLTGREEIWLADHAGAPAAPVVTWLLDRCLTRLDDQPVGRDLARRLLVGDRDFLIMQLRRLTLGDRVSAVVVCPACGAKMDIDFEISAAPVEPRPQTAAVHTLTVAQPDGAARPVHFRLPAGADQEAVLGLPVEQAVTALLKRCLIDDGGAPLSDAQRAAVIEAMDRLAPQLELELELTCPECAHAFLLPFDLTAFFLQEMRLNGARLLREAHYLALYYHWSETEILRLTRPRRRQYLALLQESSRRE